MHISQWETKNDSIIKTYLYLSFVWPGKSRLEYCFDKALKSFSPRPDPPRAGSNVGRAAVVIVIE